jgi:hypothetical protein
MDIGGSSPSIIFRFAKSYGFCDAIRGANMATKTNPRNPTRPERASG